MNRYGVRERVTLPSYGSLTALLPTTVAIVSLASLLLMVQTSRVATAGYDLNRLSQIRDEWRNRNYQLEAEIARLQSLDYVEKEAVARFTMKPATDHIYVTVTEPLKALPPLETQPPTRKAKPAEETRRKWWDALLHPLAFFNESRIIQR
ncbi:MAG: hypothetical protein HYX92_15695 [Chloroflexi bacterium]|nr:hypothetical protein [Chloroflexota bacterium]